MNKFCCIKIIKYDSGVYRFALCEKSKNSKPHIDGLCEYNLVMESRGFFDKNACTQIAGRIASELDVELIQIKE